MASSSSSSWHQADAAQNSSPHQAQLDRQMLRHLMSRYSADELSRLMQEESTVASSHNDAASVLTSSTYSSVKSEDAPSIFDSASSIRTQSDASSVRNSIISNVSTRTANFLSRKNNPQTQSQLSVTAAPDSQLDRDDSSWGAQDDDTAAASSADPAAASAAAIKQKGIFTCGFCKEEDIQKTCTRKNDLKRHIEDFHNMDAQWFCRHRGCQMIFDWQTAYKTHLKHAHGGSRSSLDDAKVDLCPQTVFACGFETCPLIFEAPSDDEAGATFKEYVAHVVKHFDEGGGGGEWTYSARIRNLLRQSGVMRAWNNSSWPEPDRNRLSWHPQTSGILRKRLETRHIGDLQLLIQYAIAMGSNPGSVQDLREDFVVPVRDDCRMPIQGHRVRTQPISADAAATTAPAMSESDPFQFKISRGTNPGLAAYLASQRRVYVPRAPVRSGRSGRPPMHAVPRPSTSTSTHMASQYGYPPATPTMFDPQQRQHHNHQQFAMVPQVNGGIIADDLRSLRSLASGPSADVEMGDAQVVHQSYLLPHQQQHQQQQQQQHQQHGFPGSYEPNGLQSPAITDGCGLSSPSVMEQHHPFGAYDAPHAY